MLCPACNVEKPEKDFINKQELCYRCEYRKRVKESKENRTIRIMYCRMCSKEVPHNFSLKKRQRTIFCSKPCAEKGHEQLRKNHWTRKASAWRLL